MNKYNKFMVYLWLTVAIASAIIVTYKGISEGFERWYSYYVISGISFFMYIVRRWMIKRMEKHLEYLKNNSN
jgi:SNF family Na+-dependent transporter